MADPQDVALPQVVTEVPVTPHAPEAKKKTPRVKKAKASPRQSARKSSAKTASSDAQTLPAGAPKRKIYSKEERARKLAQIEKAVSGGISIKNAVAAAAISEQTYYQWKKVGAPGAKSDDLKDLLALEEENKRLKSLLAERLRKENAELKKKLGLA